MNKNLFNEVSKKQGSNAKEVQVISRKTDSSNDIQLRMALQQYNDEKSLLSRRQTRPYRFER